MQQTAPPVTIRVLTEDDAHTSRALGWEAFGVPSPAPTEAATISVPGREMYGAFDGTILAARMADRAYDSYFGGALVSTAGIASVTVAAEYRGQGLLSPLFAEVLGAAKRRGALISTLYPSAAKIYRKFGYELVSDFYTVTLPTGALATVRAERTSTRRATAADFPAIAGIYDTWAAAQNGPLSRKGESFPIDPAEFIEEFTGVSLAIDGDQIVGYVSWERGKGVGEGAAMEITDLLATTVDGYRALLAAIGSFSSVCPVTKIDTSGDDLLRYLLPTLDWKVSASDPYMLKVLDVVGALEARRYLPGVTAELSFRVAGDFLAENNGGYRLTVADGAAKCVRDDDAQGLALDQRGLALLYAGVQSCANLRAAGLAGGETEDALWDGLFGGRQVHIRDYF